MKSYLYYSKYFILALVLCYSEMFSASRVASVSGNWNSTATWGGQSVPVSGDNVTINTGIVVTCTANAVCDNLTLANTNGSITINTGVTLTVRGLLNCSASASSDVIGGTGTIVLTGAATSSPFLVFGNNMSASAVFNNITFDPGSGNNITVGTGNIKADALILFNSGTTTLAAGTEIRGSTGTATLTVNSGATLSLSGQIRSSSTATTFISVVNINGTLTTSNYVNATTLNIGASGVLNTSLSGTNNTQGWWYQSSSPTTVNLNSTSTVNYNAAAAQIIANAYTYGHLTTGGSGSKTLSGATTVAGSLTIGTGTTLDVTSSNYALNVAGNWSNSGTFTAQNGTVTLNGTGAQSIGGGVSTSFYNLTVNKSGGTATLGIAQTVGGNLSISSNSSLDCSTYQITGNSSGTMSMSSGSSLILGSTGSSTAVSFPTLFTSGNTSLNLSSTVTYQTNGAQTVSGTPAYGNLIIAGSGTKTLASNTTVKGNLTINSGTLDCSNFQITGSTAGKLLTLAASTGLILGSPTSSTAIIFPTNYTASNISLDNTSTVTYQSNGAQNISSTPAYGNLILGTGASSATKTLLGATQVNGKLTINSSTTLDVTSSGNYSVLLYGDWVNNGTFNAQKGTVALNGSVNQNISGSSSSYFYNLTLNNSAGATLSTSQGVTGTLQLNSGTFSTNGKLTLVATSSYVTGNIGPIDPSANISGNVTVQQYGARGGYTGWAMLGTPMTSLLTFSDWNDNFVIQCLNCPNGYYYNFTSIYGYDETQAGAYGAAAKYSAITGTTDAITPGKGYWVYLGTSSTNTSPIMFDVTGIVANGNANSTLPLTYTNHVSSADDGWNLISNPLPSPIQWSKLKGSTSNIDDAIYIYNADLNGNTGGYASYINGVSSPAVGAGGIGDTIPMCQAIFVHSTGATSLNATESVKVSGNPTFLRMDNNQIASYKPVLRLNLTGPSNTDETAFYFESGPTTHFETNYDAYKLINDPSVPYIASMADTFMCVINGLPDFSHNMSIPVKAISALTNTFVISMSGNIPNGVCVNLYDRFTGITTNMATSTYSCTLYDTTNTARFVLNIGTNSLSATANLTQPSCTNSNGIITAKGNNAGPWNYTWRDGNGIIVRSSPNKAQEDSLVGLNGGNYELEINTVGQCDYFSQIINVNSVMIPSAQFVPNSDTVYLPAAFASFTNNSQNASTYSWDFGDGMGTSSVLDPGYSYLSSGDFTVSLIANSSTSCSDTAKRVIHVINPSTGVVTVPGTEIKLVNEGFEQYGLKFSCKKETDVNLNLFDYLGKSIYSTKISGITQTAVNIDLSNFAKGSYLLQVNAIGEPAKIFRLVKQ